MTQPLVSCLCCTYGRPLLLGEAIKCFIDQDYQNKELIVLNDQVGVELFIENCPSTVKIVNHPTRFNSLGEKRNYLKSLGNGNFFCIWDDDDLYTPWRISDSVNLMQLSSRYDIIKARESFKSVDNTHYSVVNNPFHSQSIITKDYVAKTQYPSKSVGEDTEFENGARIGYRVMFPNFHYIYRWGMGVHHVSAIEGEKKSWQKSLTFEPYQMSGRIEVKPLFQKDYWNDIGLEFEKMNPEWRKEWEKRIKIR